MIPKRLFGREQELRALEAIYQRATRGQNSLCLLAGYSGVGKSALINALRPFIEGHGGRMISGKFDQLHRDIPYSALIEAFKLLLRQVLSGKQTELVQWQQKIMAVLGENAGIVTAILPDLERIIGVQLPAPVLSGDAEHRRFNELFSRLIHLFAEGDAPLTIFWMIYSGQILLLYP